MLEQLRTTCPLCSAGVKVREEHFGKRVRCPKCKQPFEVSSVKMTAGRDTATGAADTDGPGPAADLDDKPAAKSPLESSRKLGRFEIRQTLGQGAFGRVYRANDPQLDREIALKVPTFDATDESKVRRFLDEAKSAAQLRHPNIVPVHDSGEVNGQYFIASQFIEGQTLSQRIKEDPPSIHQAAEWAQKLADALAYSHRQGVVHRDIKSDNILIDHAGEPQISDFGLAKRLSDDGNFTIDGTVLGTAAYMPPEQARGEIGNVGPLSDQYSLGVVLYEMLTGTRPFDGPHHAVIAQVTSVEPPAPRTLRKEIPRDLEAICLKATSKEAKRRYSSADALADDLDAWLHNQPIKARRVSPLEKGWLWCRRRPAVSSLLAALVLTTVLGTLVAVERNCATQAAALVDKVVTSEIDDVPNIVKEIDGYRFWANPRLQKKDEQLGDDSPDKLKLALALLVSDDTKRAFLEERLFAMEPEELLVVSQFLKSNEKLNQLLWTTASDGEQQDSVRFRAFCALAAFDAANKQAWQQHRDFLAKQLVAEATQSPRDYQTILKLLEPVRGKLTDALIPLAQNESLTAAEQNMAVNVLMEYSRDQVDVICAALLNAEDSKQFGQILSVIEPKVEVATPLLEAEIQKSLEEIESENEKELLGKRQASAAIALLRLGRPESAWTVLEHRSDPRARTYMIHRMAPWGVPADKLIGRLTSDTDETPEEVSIRRALVLSLGEYDEQQLPTADRLALVPKLLDLYRTHSDPGMHGAAEWLLRTWGHESEITAARDSLAESDSDLEKRDSGDRRRWYVNREGLTMMLIDATSFVMGSSDTDPDHYTNEKLHRKQVNRWFGISTVPVTQFQFRRFQRENPADALNTDHFPRRSAAPLEDNAPVTQITWHEAAAFCNWLSEKDGIPEDQWCYVIKPKDEFVWTEPVLPHRYSGATADILQALNFSTVMKFEETPLGDVVAYLKKLHDIEIHLDHRALGDVGKSKDTPITVDAKDLSLRSALRLILEEHSLGYVLRDDVLLITRPLAGVQPKQFYLSLRGYRLVTEAEWEFSCRAGADTRRYYGEQDSQLVSHAWFAANSQRHAWPVALKQPNDFGIFDMYGNVWEWCHDRHANYAMSHVDSDTRLAQQTERRTLRGGSYNSFLPSLRSAAREGEIPDYRSEQIGFRVARSYPLGDIQMPQAGPLRRKRLYPKGTIVSHDGLYNANIEEVNQRKAIKIWDSRDSRLLGTFTTNLERNNVVFSPNEARAVILGAEAFGESSKIVNKLTAIETVLSTPAPRRYATVVDLITGSEIDGLIRHQYFGRSANGGLIAIKATDTAALKVVDVEKSKTVATIQSDRAPAKITFSLDENLVAVAYDADDSPQYGRKVEVVEVWNLKNGKMVAEIRPNADLHSIAFSPLGNLVAVASGSYGPSWTQSVEIWHLGTGKLVMKRQVAEPGHVLRYSEKGESLLVSDSEWDPDMIELWNLNSGEMITDFGKTGNYLWKLSRDESILAVAQVSRDRWRRKFVKELQIWNFQAGELQTTVRPMCLFDEMSIATDSSVIAAYTYTWSDQIPLEGEIRLWNSRTGELEATIPCNCIYVKILKFSPDDRLLVATNMHGEIWVFDLESGKQVQHLRQPIGKNGPIADIPFNYFRFSPDGRTLWTANSMGTARWTVETVSADD